MTFLFVSKETFWLISHAELAKAMARPLRVTMVLGKSHFQVQHFGKTKQCFISVVVLVNYH